MQKIIKYSVTKIALAVLLLFISTVSFAQWTLDVVGTVKKEETNKRVDGVTITVKKNGATWKTITSESAGKFQAILEPEGVYLIEFSLPGHVTKRIEFSTKNVPLNDSKYGFEFPMEMNLFEKMDGLDVTILNKPIAKVAFNPATGYMDYDPEYTKSIKSELDRLKKELEEKLKAQEAERKAKQASYDKAILAADKAYNTQKWGEAKPLYEEASRILPLESYPKLQLVQISGKMAALDEVNKKYTLAISEGDKAFLEKKWDVATTSYQKAIALKSTEKYPADKILEIKGIIANEKKGAEEYSAAVASGDQFFNLKDYVKAKDAYTKASALRTSEQYPKTKLNDIEKLLADSKKKEEDYKNAIAEADNNFNLKDYENSKIAYNRALVIKPNEEYPRKKIIEADKFLSDMKKVDADYKNTILIADQSLMAKDYPKAKASYQQASTIKPVEKYPKEKLVEIENILSELAKKKASDESALMAQKDKDDKYNRLIASADNSLVVKKYDEAKSNYNQALGVKPAEKYPKDKLLEIEKILADIAAKKSNEEASILAENEKYNKIISEADNELKTGNYERAKLKYNEALSVRKNEQYPKDKLNEITKILAELSKKNVDDKLAQETEKKKREYYNAVIAQADGELLVKKYEEAKTKFNEASAILPNETYPKIKIKEIDDLLAKINADQENSILAVKEKNDKYNALIAQADSYFATKQYENAKSNYKSALNIKVNESYPKTKINEIDLLLAELLRKETENALENNALKQKLDRYNLLIKKGDELFSKKTYKDALNLFNDAANLMPSESYPKEKIILINGILADLAKQEKDNDNLVKQEKEKRDHYTNLIYDADRAFKFAKYLDAKNKYEQALGLYSEEKYPKEQLEEIAVRMKKENETIAVSNEPIGPRVKITDSKEKEIETMMADLLKNINSDKAIALDNYRKEVENGETILISSSNNKRKNALTDIENQERNIKTKYSEADKLHLENHLKIVTEQVEYDRAEKTLASTAENRRQKAKQDNKVAEENMKLLSSGKDVLLESKVQELYSFADQVIENELILQENAKSRRDNNNKDFNNLRKQLQNDVIVAEERRKDREMKVDEYKFELREKENILISKANERRANAVQEIDEYENNINVSAKMQNENYKNKLTNQFDFENLVFEQETKNNERAKAKIKFNQDSLELVKQENFDLHLERSRLFEANVDKIKELNQANNNLHSNNIKASKYKREQNSNELYKFNEDEKLNSQRQNQIYKTKTAYLNDYKNELAEVEKQRVSRQKESRQLAKTKNEDMENNIISTHKSKAEFHLRFYDKLEQERTKNDQVFADLNAISYQKIRSVKSDDYYVGELKPSENIELSSKYPQGISEEAKEEGNAVILKRIKVTGKHVDVYQKIHYKWGGVFYTKNGYNITKTLWDLESIEK